MVRSLAKHSGFFKKKDKNTIPETDMQENAAQMMEEPMDQDPVQEDADIADTDVNDIGVQETAVDAGNAVDEADIADDDTETSEDLDDTDRNSQAAEEYEETGNIIDCDSLVKIYKTDEVEVMALQGLELTIKKGEPYILWYIWFDAFIFIRNPIPEGQQNYICAIFRCFS